ncbi:MAG: DUF4183 domain-containing protein [Patescibacteria group bacterium]|nr:DUF4183 domain-containing protein [Patescibacteria group bacterium]
MPVPNTIYQNTYTADGVTTSYAFTWACVETSSVQVYINGVLQTTGYSVSLSLTTYGGTVAFTVAPASGAQILIERVSNLLQNNTLGSGNAPLPPATITAMIDKLTIIMQQLANSQVALAAGTTGIAPTFPSPIAGALLAWNTGPTGFANVASIAAGYALIDQGPGNGFASGPVTTAAGGNMAGPSPAINTAHSVPLWNGTDGRTIKSGAAPVQSGNVLTDNGTGADPSFQCPPTPQQVRLYCVSGSPADGADHTGVTALYAGPYGGNNIEINGVRQTFSEVSTTVPATTTQMYSLFAKSASATSISLNAVAWTNDTTPGAAATTLINGCPHLASDTTQLLIGVFRTGTVSGQTIDSAASRLVQSYYNPLPVTLYAQDTATRTYTTAAWRTADVNTTPGTGRVEFISILQRALTAAYQGCVSSTSGNPVLGIGLGLDSTTAPVVDNFEYVAGVGAPEAIISTYAGMPNIGYHYLQGFEYGAAGGEFIGTQASQPCSVITARWER